MPDDRPESPRPRGKTVSEVLADAAALEQHFAESRTSDRPVDRPVSPEERLASLEAEVLATMEAERSVEASMWRTGVRAAFAAVRAALSAARPPSPTPEETIERLARWFHAESGNELGFDAMVEAGRGVYRHKAREALNAMCSTTPGDDATTKEGR